MLAQVVYIAYAPLRYIYTILLKMARLAYIILYESWLLGVFRIYTTRGREAPEC